MSSLRGQLCEIDECGRPARTSGSGKRLCTMHDQRWRRIGGTSLPVILPLETCAVTGCHKNQKSRKTQFCAMHLSRIKRQSKDGLSPSRTNCVQCDKALPLGRNRFCSPTCRGRHWRGTPHMRTCIMCGTAFETNDCAKTCSAECSAQLYGLRHHMRRARILSRPIEVFSRLEIFERDKYQCKICGETTDKNAAPRSPTSPSLDHKIPLARGGAHLRANVQCSHYRCNLKKQATILVAP